MSLSTESLADHRHEPTTREDRLAKLRAIRERTTRGLMLYNSGPDFAHLEGSLWAVRASQGGYWKVDLDSETCDCPDFVHYGRENDVCCKHLIACAIAHSTRRGRRQPVEDRPCACVRGWVYIGVEEDGLERQAAIRCRRCSA